MAVSKDCNSAFGIQIYVLTHAASLLLIQQHNNTHKIPTSSTTDSSVHRRCQHSNEHERHGHDRVKGV